MTIDATNNNPRIRYSVSEGASQTNFTVPFEFFDDSDLYVYVDGIIKTITTDYTVTGGDGSTGDISFVSPVVGATGGSIVVITRNIPIERVTDFVTGVDISRAALNTQLDTLTALIADVNDTGSRSIRLADTDASASLTIPSAADRANGFLSFDSNGDVAVNAIVNLDFLDLERLDIDNLRLDGNTLSSLAGNITLDSLGDITLDHASLGSIYFSRAGTAFGEIYGRNATSELRLYGDDSGTLITLTAEHVSASSTIARLKTDNAALYLDTDSGGLIYLQANSDVIKLDVATANNLKISTSGSNEVFILNNSGLTIDGSITSTYGYFTDIYSSSLRTSVGVDWLSRGADYVQFKSGASSSDYAQINFDNVASDIIKLKSFNGNDLHLDAENVVSLLYNGGVKLSTKTDGVTVTGDVGATTGTFTGDVSAVNATLTGYLRGPATFTIDPATHGDNTGTVVIAGDLQVDGTTTTINSTTLTVDDANIVVASGAANAAAADGAGLTIDGANITFTYDDSDGRMELNKELFVYGNSTNGEASFVSISNSDTGGDDIRIQGTNPTYTNYDTTIPTSGVSEYIGGHNFLGRLTSSSYHTYSAIRPYIVEGLDSNTTGKKGGLHFGVSDGSSSAVTNIILKVEPDGIDVTGTVTADGLTVDGDGLFDSDTAKVTVKSFQPKLILDDDSAVGAGSDKLIIQSVSGQSAGDYEFVLNNDQTSSADQTAIKISGNGDISFYDSAGSSQSFFWDANEERLGLGTTSPARAIEIENSTNFQMRFQNTSSTGNYIEMADTSGSVLFGNVGGAFTVQIGGSTNYASEFEAMRIESDGDVLLGDSIFNEYAFIRPYEASTGNLIISSDHAATGTNGSAIKFRTRGDGADKMIIEHSGNVGIGTSSPNNMLTLENGDLQIHETGSSDPLVQLSVGGTQASPTQSWVLRVDNSDSDKFQLLDQTDNRVVLTADGDGKVGIGTSSPAGKLQVYTSANRFQSLTGASADLEIVSDNNTNPVALIKGTGTADLLNVFDNTTEVFTILDGGNVGIGTSSPAVQMHVAGTGNADVAIQSGDSSTASVLFGDTTDVSRGRVKYINSSDAMTFEVNNLTEAMRIDSSGNVGIGTSSISALLHIESASASITPSVHADELLVEGSGNSGITIGSGTSAQGSIRFADSGGDSRGQVNYDHSADSLRFYTADSLAATISSLGRVGIGTSDPQSNLQISSSSSPVLKLTGGSTGTPQIHFGDLDSDIGMIEYKNSNDSMQFTTAGSDRVTIDSSGNVGIGTSSPSAPLTVKSSGQAGEVRMDSDSGAGRISSNGDLQFYTNNSAYSIQFKAPNDGTEHMRIDSSGNLLVGKTSNDNTTAGIVLRPNGDLASVRDGGNPLLLNRLTSDGDIALFRKDGSTVGSIGTYSSGLDIAGSSRGIRFSGSTIFPVTNAGGVSDNSVQLGYSGGRFKDLYLSGGVYLGGTGSANKLTDYEEGSWTPTFSSGTATLSYRRYTKIGDVVHFWMEVVLTGTRGSETFTISGLPFNANYFQACSGYAQDYTDEGSQGFAPFVRQNTSQIRINSFGAEIIGTKLGNGYLNISGTYRTA